MAKPTDRELDNGEEKTRVALALIESARNFAQRRGVAPGPWLLALIHEIALVITTQQAGSDTTVAMGLDLVLKLITETVEELRASNNPRIVSDDGFDPTPPMGMTVILIGGSSEDDADPMQQVHDAIAKGAKQP